MEYKSSTLAQLKAQLEDTDWAIRHHLGLSMRCPYRVAWLYPIGKGLAHDGWFFGASGAGQPTIAAPVAVHITQSDLGQQFGLVAPDGTFVSTWNQEQRCYRRLMILAHPMPIELEPFELLGPNGRQLSGLIYKF